MKAAGTVLRFLYSIYALITFVAIMLLVFPFAVIGSFFGRIRGGNFAIWLCQRWADLWFPLIFIFHSKKYETPHNKSRPYIFVVNHISYLDAAILCKAIQQPLRPLGKVEMAKVPFFGFIYRYAIVTVDRSNAHKRANSVRVLKSVLNKGISILVFPEGTFNMTPHPLKEFYDGAFRIAIETQTPVKPVLFLDANERMPHHSVFSMSPGRSRIVYLDEIPVEGLTLADVKVLKERVYKIMEVKLSFYRNS